MKSTAKRRPRSSAYGGATTIDQYLARVYRLASQRFHLAEWDTSILRKLHTLESIYTKIADRATNRRMETLEWIIIVLIAFSILLPFLISMPQH